MSLQFRKYTEGDEQEICNLHNDIFPDTVKWTKPLWQWRYLNKGRKNSYVCVDKEGIAGHLGSVENQFIINNKSVTCALVIDAMTNERLRTQGAFLRLTMLCLKNLKQNYKFVYSFLNENSYPIFQKLFKWRAIGNNLPIRARPLRFFKLFKSKFGFLGSLLALPAILIFKLFFSPRVSQKFQYSSVKKFDEQFTNLWQQCRDKNLIVRERDHKYLNWRYIDSVYEYDNECLYLDGQLQGFAVFSVINRFGVKLGLILEFITNTNNKQAAYALLCRVQSRLKEAGADVASCISFKHSSDTKIFRRCGFFSVPKSMLPHPLYLYVAPSNDFGEEIYSLDNWYISYGDVDSV